LKCPNCSPKFCDSVTVTYKFLISIIFFCSCFAFHTFIYKELY